MFPELSLCVNGQESEYIFDVNAYESEYSKIDKSGNIYESGKISSSVTLVLVGDLDEKVSSARYRRKRNKKKGETVRRDENLFNFWPSSRSSYKKLTSDTFSLRSQQMVPNYFLYPYKYPEFHLRKIWPQFLTK